MDQNTARTHAALGLMVALLDQLKGHGTLTDQDVDGILAKVPSAVRMINPSFNNHKAVAEVVELVRQTLR
jgi:hypothetical protein